MVVSHFWVPKTLTFKVYETTLVKMSFSCIRIKIILDQLAICTSPIIHPVSTPAPPPTFCTIIVFSFSWDDCNTQEKWKTKVIQLCIFVGVGGGRGTRCIMGDIHTYMFYLFGVLYNKGYINQYIGDAQVDNCVTPSLALKQNIEATSMTA